MIDNNKYVVFTADESDNVCYTVSRERLETIKEIIQKVLDGDENQYLYENDVWFKVSRIAVLNK